MNADRQRFYAPADPSYPGVHTLPVNDEAKGHGKPAGAYADRRFHIDRNPDATDVPCTEVDDRRSQP
jgi:hypothetical protein